MDKNKVNLLRKLLKRANKENTKELRNKTKDFLKSVEINDLIMAEQSLIEGGVKAEDLRNLCAAHIELMSDQIGKKTDDLPQDHPIKILMAEHDEILKFLEQLEVVNNQVQSAAKLQDLNLQLLKDLTNIADHLVAAEKHYQREEDALFPEVEKLGVFGPTEVMRSEHVDLKMSKKALQKLVHEVNPDFNKFKTELNKLTKDIIFNLRDHIFKENNILYPNALEIITEKNIWKKMKTKCDEIGYCCFTPKSI